MSQKKEKPVLSFWQIWNMSFGFLGIQFGFGLQNANVSRIFQTLGANIDDIPILWVAAPVTGLIVQPIIGYLSDRTWHPVLGRRRPFFLIGAILASIALLIMPNSPYLWVAAGMLWILDASINISMEPFRAFVGDNLPDSQRTLGFSMQTFFIGIGAIIASVLPWVLANWLGVSNEGGIPDSVKYSFYIGGFVFFLAVLWTVLKSKEYPPEELDSFEESKAKEAYSFELGSDEEFAKNGKKQAGWGAITLVIGALFTFFLFKNELDKQLFILSFGIALLGLLLIFAGSLQIFGKNKSPIVTTVNDFQWMPKTMRQLAGVQFFSWFALFSMWIYTTAGVTSSKYDMKLSPELVGELTQIATTITPDEEGKHDQTLKDLNEMTEKIKEGAPQVTATVNVINYFLDNRILPEKEMLDVFASGINNVSIGGDTLKDAKKELAKLDSLYADNLPGNDQLIPFSTFDFVLKHKDEVLEASTSLDPGKLSLIGRLKEISRNYNEGANWVGVCFGVYNGLAALFAFLLIFLAKKTNRKTTHAISLFVGSLSFLSIFFIETPGLLLIPFVGIGLVWASILAMPYAILTTALPSKKMGYYMGVFNFFIVIPQILAATLLGFFVRHLFDGEAIYAQFLGAASFFIAAILVFFVDDKGEPVQ